MTAVGRPSLYDPDYPRQAYNLCMLGATNQQLADHFEVSIATITTVWRKDHPEFLEACNNGRLEADTKVATALYKRALGYKHKAVKIITVARGNGLGSSVEEVPYIEHYPPDTQAAMFWLKNRQPDKWKERSQVDLKHGLDDSLTALLAQSYSGAALPIAEASQPIQVIPAPDATNVAPLDDNQ